MPVLSLHNTYTLPSGSASYTLGLSGAPGSSSYNTYPNVGQSSGVAGISSVLGGTLSGVGLGAAHSSLLSSGLGTTGLNLTSTNLLSDLGGGASRLTSLGLGYNTSSYSTYTNPLITSGAMKLKTLDDFDIGISRYNRVATPCSPIPGSWGLDGYSRIDGINPGFMHSQSRPLSRLGALDDLDGESFLYFYSIFLHFYFRSIFLLRKRGEIILFFLIFWLYKKRILVKKSIFHMKK
jgi:RIMS-binding protein 2